METVTLKNLKEVTKEQVFDQVAKHLLQQQRRSLSEGGSTCFYRGRDGLKCAAGCLIADDEYDEFWEGNDWGNLVQAGYVPKEHESLIRRLQGVHDNFNVKDWKDKLTELAKEFEIKSNILEK